MLLTCFFLRNEAVGPGCRIAVLMEVFVVLCDRPQIFRGAIDASGYHLLNLRPTRAADSLASFRMVGAMAAYITWMSGWAPKELSPIFLVYAIGGKMAVSDINLIDQLLPSQATILQSWPEERGPFTDVSPTSPLVGLAIEYLANGCV